MRLNAQKMICEAFGYKSPLGINIMTSSEKQARNIMLVDDNLETCSMCGQKHNIGYKSVINGENLLKTLISDTYNECYSIKSNNFICEYCGYSLKAYGSPSKSLYGKKMINVLVHNNKAIEKSFNSDDKNELYDILINPPVPPFVILINSRGTVLENLVFTAKPSISKGYIVVNYGLSNLEVIPSEVFECIEDAKEIALKYGIETNSDSIWNRTDDVKILVKKKTKKGIVNLDDFFSDMSFFLSSYNRDTRVVGKMILLAYLKKNKTNTTKEKIDKNAVVVEDNLESKTLFDF